MVIYFCIIIEAMIQDQTGKLQSIDSELHATRKVGTNTDTNIIPSPHCYSTFLQSIV